MNKEALAKKGAGALALLILSHPAVANNNTDTAGNVTVSTSLGLLNAESIESVYQSSEPNQKLSQLNWEANNTPIVKNGYRLGCVTPTNPNSQGLEHAFIRSGSDG